MGDWETTRSYDINYKADSSKEDTHDMVVCLGSTTNDLAASQGAWDENCTEKEDGHGVVLLYSGDSV